MEEKKMMMEYAELKVKYRLLKALVELSRADYDGDFFKVRKADIIAALDEPVREDEQNGGVDKD